MALGSKSKRIPNLDLLGPENEGAPTRPIQPFVKGGLNPGLSAAPADATPPEASRNHPAVVDDETITPLQQIRKVANDSIFQAGAPPGFTTKSRAASRGRAGRKAMRSAGRSKSNKSVRMRNR